jgi:prepilin-type N-terminal cleavage/methylation domain-containing protein
MCGTRTPKGFTLIEMMAVTLLIMILAGVVGLSFMNSRDGVKFRKDGAQCLTFLRLMWDFSKTSNAPLVLQSENEGGRLAFVDPRTGTREHLRLESQARVMGALLNDRFHSLVQMGNGETAGEPASEPAGQADAVAGEGSSAYLSEGRGLTTLGLLLALPGEEEGVFKAGLLVRLNLITGKGKIEDWDPLQLQGLLDQAQADQALTQEGQP